MSYSLEPLLDSVKVARILGVEPDTLAAWRRRGYGPRWYRIGKNVRYSESDLRSWMGAQATTGLKGAHPDRNRQNSQKASMEAHD